MRLLLGSMLFGLHLDVFFVGRFDVFDAAKSDCGGANRGLEFSDRRVATHSCVVETLLLEDGRPSSQFGRHSLPLILHMRFVFEIHLSLLR